MKKTKDKSLSGLFIWDIRLAIFTGFIAHGRVESRTHCPGRGDGNDLPCLHTLTRSPFSESFFRRT